MFGNLSNRCVSAQLVVSRPSSIVNSARGTYSKVVELVEI